MAASTSNIFQKSNGIGRNYDVITSFSTVILFYYCVIKISSVKTVDKFVIDYLQTMLVGKKKKPVGSSV